MVSSLFVFQMALRLLTMFHAAKNKQFFFDSFLHEVFNGFTYVARVVRSYNLLRELSE